MFSGAIMSTLASDADVRLVIPIEPVPYKVYICI